MSDLEFAEHLADVAREITMAAFGPRLPVDHKYDHSPVTELDGAAERAIRAAVQAAFPDDAVLGEEEGLTSGTSGRTWIVDPIDGTRMFAEGIPTWTTLIGLRDETGYVVGVADAPAIGERASAKRGGGAWLRSQGSAPRRLSVSDVTTLAESFVGHASIEEFADRDDIDTLIDLVRASRGTRTLVDAWGHTLVARGATDAMVEALPCFEWDWAATSVIVSEAGGRITQWDGSDPTPGCSLVVTNGTVEAELIGLLRQQS